MPLEAGGALGATERCDRRDLRVSSEQFSLYYATNSNDPARRRFKNESGCNSSVTAAIMALSVPATFTALFAHVRFRYRGGWLHSENDEPALLRRLTARSLECGFSCPNEIGYICAKTDGDSVQDFVYFTSYNDLPAKGQKYWYSDGDLHREYGPAIIGPMCGCVGVLCGAPWHAKYHRGRQASSKTNTHVCEPQATYESERRENSPRFPICCASNCATLIARGMVDVNYVLNPRVRCAKKVGARVYQTCTGIVIECLADFADLKCRHHKLGDTIFETPLYSRYRIAPSE